MKKKTAHTIQEVNINCFIVSQMLYCLQYFNLPASYKNRLNKLALDLDHYCLPIVDEYRSWDVVKEKWELTTFFEEFVPKTKRND